MKLLRTLAAVSVIGLSGGACDRRAAPQETAALDADAAAHMAALLANSEAKLRFDAAPFDASQDTPKFAQGRWRWEATAGYGKGDLQAIVSFTQTGSNPGVLVQRLVLTPSEPAQFKAP